MRYLTGPNCSRCPVGNAFTAVLCTANRLQEIISLSLADGSLESLHDLKHVFPDFAFFRGRLVSEQVRRVIRDHQRNAVVSMPAATQFAHCRSRSEQSLDSDRAERDQHSWLNDVDLFHKIRQTRL